MCTKGIHCSVSINNLDRLLIHTPLASRMTLDTHSIDTHLILHLTQSVNSWQSADWLICNDEHSMACLWKYVTLHRLSTKMFVKCCLKWVSTEALIECWSRCLSSVIWRFNLRVSIDNWQLTTDAFSTHALGIFNHFTPKSDLIDFTLSNARRFYSSKGDPLGVKGLMDTTSCLRGY